MSTEYMAVVWEEYPGGGDDFNLALALANSAGVDGFMCIERTLRLLHLARLTEARFERALARLQANGWLRVINAQECWYQFGPPWRCSR